MVRETAIELDGESGPIRLALPNRQCRRIRVQSHHIDLWMQLLDLHRQRSRTAPNIEHAKSASDLRLFDKPALSRTHSEDAEKRIIKWQQPAFSKRRHITSLGIFHVAPPLSQPNGCRNFRSLSAHRDSSSPITLSAHQPTSSEPSGFNFDWFAHTTSHGYPSGSAKYPQTPPPSPLLATLTIFAP